MLRKYRLFTEMQTVLPEGEVGSAKLEHFTVSTAESNLTQVRSILSREDPVAVGTYARLLINGSTMMSDTLGEQRSNMSFVLQAQQSGGSCLVAGLGIGMILLHPLSLLNVKNIDVVEKNPDVIALVERPLKKFLGKDSKKLNVIEADIFEWKPPKGQKWDVIYFDIWGDYNTDLLPEITRLKRKFAKRLNRENPECWMGAWRESELRYYKRKEREEARMWRF